MSEFDALVKGASISQLATLFQLNRRTVTNRLRYCVTAGKKGGHNTYQIVDAAPLLLNNDVGDDDEKKRTPESEKHYWDARLKQQKFEENEGDLLRTAEVILDISKILKNIALQAKLLSDNVDREVGLTQEQRAIINRLVDEFMTKASESVAIGNDPEEDDDDDLFGDNESYE